MDATIIRTTETDAIPDGYRRIRIEEQLFRVAYVAVKTTGHDKGDLALVVDGGVVIDDALLAADLVPSTLFVYDADTDETLGGGDY